MAILPLGKCPSCSHPLWDHEARLKGADLAAINMVCIYCAAPIRYDVCAGNYVDLDLSRLSNIDRAEILQAMATARRRGPAIAAQELAARRRTTKAN